jgi:hypothetical protein
MAFRQVTSPEHREICNKVFGGMAPLLVDVEQPVSVTIFDAALSVYNAREAFSADRPPRLERQRARASEWDVAGNFGVAS